MISKAEKKRLIEDYLRLTGSVIFDPREATRWLEDKPDHPFWPLVWGASDEHAAFEWRVGRMSRLVSEVRYFGIPSLPSNPTTIGVRVGNIAWHDFRRNDLGNPGGGLPGFFSDPALRGKGGSHRWTATNDPQANLEALTLGLIEASEKLAQFLERYADTLHIFGVSTVPCEQQLALIESAIPPSAAAAE